MTRLDCLKIIISMFNSQPIIFTTGFTCREAYAIEDRNNHFYMVGSMGLVSSIAAGLSHYIKSKVIIVDGDGSLLMNPSGLFLSKILEQSHLIHILLDNNVYSSTGGQNTHSENFEFCQIASSVGYADAEKVSTLDNFKTYLNKINSQNNSSSFLQAKIAMEDAAYTPRIDLPLPMISKRFKEFIGSNLYEDRIL